MLQKGFTIVELLIVIVVVAILAAITIVSYNGATLKARNTARLAAVDQARDAVGVALALHTAAELKAALNHSTVDPQYWNACVGTGYKNAVCGVYHTNPPYAKESVALNALLTSSSALPNFGAYPPTTSSDNDVVSGPYLQTMTVDGVQRLGIEYSLEGEKQACTMTPLTYTKTNGTTTLTKSSGDAANYSSYGDGVTECRFVVADL